MNVRENRDDLTRRAQALVALLNVALLVIGATFWTLQIAKGGEYRTMAENNRLRKVPIKAPRGVIFDRHGQVLAENQPSYDLLFERSRAKNVQASLAFAADVLGRPKSEVTAALTKVGPAAAYRPALLAENLTLAQVARFGVASYEHPEFEIDVSHRRLYHGASDLAHVLGYLSEVSEEDLAAAKGLYSAGDQVGRRGVEATYDRDLRGQDGERILVVDSRGTPLEEHGKVPAAPGTDLTLTLDAELQHEAYRLLGDQVGVVVALDPRNGEILALASAPSYDPNLFTRRLEAEEWRQLVSSPFHPLQNRALQNRYSPGSVFKIVMAVAGLAEGVVGPQDTVLCNGSTTIYNRRFRCWKKGGHGTVNLQSAIKYSCDVYFYHLGQRLGIERIAKYGRLFHLGRATGIDLLGEKHGLVPDPEWSLKVRKHPWYAGETISVAIGQGPLLVTPIQVAGMLAVVANGGRFVVPHLRKDAAFKAEPLLLDQRALAAVRRGLWAVVNDSDGTGRQARLDGLEVAGKTGTVQVVTQETWTSSDDLPFEKRDHAWFASFAPYESPTLVVVVFVEHGGKGSAAAAPIARALYERYFQIRSADAGASVAG